MIKKILRFLAALAIVALVIFLVILYYKLQPSGDMKAYGQYEVNDLEQPVNDQVKVTFFGVSTLLFDDGETQILLDGFFSRYSLLDVLLKDLRSDTVAIDAILAAHGINRLKGIFVTHSHYDHAFDVAYTTGRTGATLYGSRSTLNIARGGGVREQQLQQFKPQDEFQLGNFSIRIVPSIHSPGNALKDDAVEITNPLKQPANMKQYAEGGTFDFYIQHKGRAIYVKPSPNYIAGALDSLKAHAVFIGIATITNHPEEWQHEFYKHTLRALKPQVVVPVHWDDFFKTDTENLVMLPRFANDGARDFDYFIQRTKTDGIDFRILQGRKSIILFK